MEPYRRQKNSPEPIAIEPVYVRGASYLTLTDYARREGITRLTAADRVKKGLVDWVRVGPKTVLVRVLTADDIPT